MDMFGLLYILLMVYSFLCAPDVWFDIFEYRDSPEYAFAYIIGCVILGLTLIGAAYRMIHLIKKTCQTSK